MLGVYLENVRSKKPLIHNITNYVTVNDVANILLACGASPIMSDDVGEVEDITSICAGLCINIGTLNQNTIPSMLLAGRRAEALGHKTVLDPVGAGASRLRTETALRLSEQVRFDVIRGNISEVKALALGSGGTKGVDADVADAVTEDTLDSAVSFVQAFSRKTGSVIAVTGAIDLVADGKRCAVIRNGRPEMGRITGTGCQLSAMLAAYITANPEKVWEAAAAAVCAMGLAGEIGYRNMLPGDGNVTYRSRIIDAVYAITDRSWLGGETLYAQTEKALRGGATFLQLREKELDRDSFRKEAMELKTLCRKYRVPFLIDDDVALALETEADGVHVGQSDAEAGEVRKLLGEGKILGVSAQTVEQARRAEQCGADYLGVGAVFHTGTKPDAKDVSFDTLKEICSAVRIPVVAIGGISKDNILRLSGSGICGVAVISAIFAQPDIEAAARELRQLAERTVSS